MGVFTSLYEHASSLLTLQPYLAWGWRPEVSLGWDVSAVRWRAEPAFFSERLLARQLVSANVTVRVLESLQLGTYRDVHNDVHSVQAGGSMSL